MNNLFTGLKTAIIFLHYYENQILLRKPSYPSVEKLRKRIRVNPYQLLHPGIWASEVCQTDIATITFLQNLKLMVSLLIKGLASCRRNQGLDAERKTEAYMQECRGDVIIMFLEKASYGIQRILRVQILLIGKNVALGA